MAGVAARYLGIGAASRQQQHQLTWRVTAKTMKAASHRRRRRQRAWRVGGSSLWHGGGGKAGSHQRGGGGGASAAAWRAGARRRGGGEARKMASSLGEHQHGGTYGVIASSHMQREGVRVGIIA